MFTIIESIKEGGAFGKLLILSLEDNEEHIINNILSCLNEETEVLRQQIVNKRKLIFDGLRIDEHKRIVVREDNEIHNDYDFFRPVIRVQTSGWRMGSLGDAG